MDLLTVPTVKMDSVDRASNENKIATYTGSLFKGTNSDTPTAQLAFLSENRTSFPRAIRQMDVISQ